MPARLRLLVPAPLLLTWPGAGPAGCRVVASAAAGAGEGACELVHLDASDPGAADHFASELRGRHAVLLDNLVGEDWPGVAWSADDWRSVLSNITLPRRKLSNVAGSGAVHAAQDVPGDTLFNESYAEPRDAAERDATVVFSTSLADPAVRKLRELGVVRTPPLLSAVRRHPVLSVGQASEGLPYHQHEEAWLALLHGQKQWFLRRPEATPRHVKRRAPAEELLDEEGTLRCLQRAGQIVYFPENWWHATYNSGGAPLGGLTVGVGGIGKHSDVLELLQEGDTSRLQELVDEDEKLGPWLAREGGLWAAKMGHAGTLDWLVRQRADLERRLDDGSTRGNTLAHVAADSGHLAVVSWLIDHRADMFAKETGPAKPGQPALQRQPIHAATEAGHLGVVQRLLEHRAKLGAKTADGMQPLGLACAAGHAEMLGWLLERLGPKAQLAGKHGAPTILAATAGGHVRMLDKLESSGASAWELNRQPQGMHPVHVATANGHADTLGWLLQRGAGLETADGQGIRPVHLAAQHGRADLLTFLHEKGANLDSTDSGGGRAIHWGSYNGHLPVLRWLVERGGADLGTRDGYGNQPAHSAAMGGNVELLKWLDEQGAVPDDVDKAVEEGSPQAAAVRRWLKGRRRKRKAGRVAGKEL